MSRLSVLCPLIVTLVGCNVENVEWDLVAGEGFTIPAEGTVRTRITTGDCEGTTLETDEFAVGESGSAPASLPPGLYGLHAEVLDPECRVVGRGCAPVAFPLGAERAQVVVEETGAWPACGASSCDGGRCDDAAAGPPTCGALDDRLLVYCDDFEEGAGAVVFSGDGASRLGAELVVDLSSVVPPDPSVIRFFVAPMGDPMGATLLTITDTSGDELALTLTTAGADLVTPDGTLALQSGLVVGEYACVEVASIDGGASLGIALGDARSTVSWGRGFAPRMLALSAEGAASAMPFDVDRLSVSATARCAQ